MKVDDSFRFGSNSLLREENSAAQQLVSKPQRKYKGPNAIFKEDTIIRKTNCGNCKNIFKDKLERLNSKNMNEISVRTRA